MSACVRARARVRGAPLFADPGLHCSVRAARPSSTTGCIAVCALSLRPLRPLALRPPLAQAEHSPRAPPASLGIPSQPSQVNCDPQPCSPPLPQGGGCPSPSHRVRTYAHRFAPQITSPYSAPLPPCVLCAAQTCKLAASSTAERGAPPTSLSAGEARPSTPSSSSALQCQHANSTRRTGATATPAWSMLEAVVLAHSVRAGEAGLPAAGGGGSGARARRAHAARSDSLVRARAALVECFRKRKSRHAPEPPSGSISPRSPQPNRSGPAQARTPRETPP